MSIKIHIAFFILVLLASSLVSFGQKTKVVSIEPKKELLKHFQNSALTFFYKDSLTTNRKVVEIVSHLHSQGYLTSAADSSSRRNDTLFVHLYISQRFRKAQINLQGVNMAAIRKMGLKTSLPDIRKFSYREFYKIEKALVDYYQTIGFPFAYVYVDSISIEKNVLKGQLKMAQGPFIVFDSLNIIGNTKTKKKFLSNLTRIRLNAPFDQTLVDNAYKLLKQLPYLRLKDLPTVSFVNGKATVNFYMEDKKANQVDGVAGFLPNQQSAGSQTTKLIVTGEFNLNLKNMAGKGKNMRIEWKRLKPESQQLSMEYFHPNLFGSPMNVIPMFDLLKQDTTFQTVTGTIKTNFNLTGSAKMGFYVGSKQSRLLSTKQYAAYSKPPFLDYNLATYGLDYEWNNLDDYFYPKKGNWIFADVNVGVKTIVSNSRLPDRLYTDVKKSNSQFYVKTEIRHFFKTGKRSTLLGSLRSGRVFNDNLLVTNDLFQIGGLKTMRGFNENFFFAEYYSTGTLEFRQFTDESSYLLVFAEQSFMKYRLGTDSVDDWPIGVGVGLSLSTNTGIFNFVYSLGQSQAQKMQFNQSKVHFGYITRF